MGGKVFRAVAGAFAPAELGDKTMLATITLAPDHGLIGPWLGSTVGMVAADGLAIGVGAMYGRRLPDGSVRLLAATAFVVFGVLLLVEGITA